jgi:hypothetical protein
MPHYAGVTPQNYALVYWAHSHRPFEGIPINIVSDFVYICRAHCHTLRSAWPNTLCHALPHTAALPHTHTLPHCCTAAHCRTLPHTATHCAHCRTLRTLPHTAHIAAHCRAHCHTLPCALPYTTKNTAIHYHAHCAHIAACTARTAARILWIHTNSCKFIPRIHIYDSHKSI